MRRKRPAAGQAANGSLQPLAHTIITLLPSLQAQISVEGQVMSAPQFATFRRFVLTGSIAAVTATGAWYGAGLKMKQDIKQVRLLCLPSLYPVDYPTDSLFRKDKKLLKQHHSNKSPNWKPTEPTSCKRKSCSTRRLKSWRSKRERKKEGD